MKKKFTVLVLIFFLPWLSLTKPEKYKFGNWSQLLNKGNYFIFYEKKQWTLHMITTDQHCPVDSFTCKTHYQLQ